MGLFSRLVGKREEPPDFSRPPLGFDQPPTKETFATPNDPFSSAYGKDPIQSKTPFDSPGIGEVAPPEQDSSFDHHIFTSDEPTNADRARAYAQTLTQAPAPAAQAYPATVAGAISGHEAQLILERLDTIKAELDSIKQRMMRVERYLDQAEQRTNPPRRYF